MTQKTDLPIAPDISQQKTKRFFLKCFVLSYAPNPLSERSVNIAAMLVGDHFAEARFVPNWQGVLALDPEADTELLTAITDEIRTNFRTVGQGNGLLRMMEDSWSNTICISPAKVFLTDDPETDIEAIVSQYLS